MHVGFAHPKRKLALSLGQSFQDSILRISSQILHQSCFKYICAAFKICLHPLKSLHW